MEQYATRVRANARMMDDLARFGRYQLATHDIDPAYPVLKALYLNHPHWSEEQRLWHTLVYVAYYNLPSSLQAVAVCRSPENVHLLPMEVLLAPTGIERRGLRGGIALQAHLYSLAMFAERFGSIATWLRTGFGDDPLANWVALQQTLNSVYYNGRWAAYKTAEILMRVHDFPVAATDMGMAFSSGPRWGLSQFFGPVAGNGRDAIEQLDAQADAMQSYLANEYGLIVGIEQLETLLCDFHALCDGRYYVGHDIDQMQEQILRAEQARGQKCLDLWIARFTSLPHLYLGEVHGRSGVDAARRRLYRDTGRLVVRDGEGDVLYG